MADDEDDPGTKRKLWPIAIALPVFYVLSIGPVIWTGSALDRVFDIDDQAFSKWMEAIYAPLVFASERSRWFSAALEWYIDLLV